MKARIFMALALAGAAVLPAACGQSEPPPAAEPDAPEGIGVVEGRLILPAVSGNPGAVYFTVENSSEEDRMIRSASMAGSASAMLHQMGTWNRQPSMDEVMQIAVPAGGSLVFEPGGLHVMVYELADTLTPGGETEVTLTFVGGDKVSFPVTIQAAGEER